MAVKPPFWVFCFRFHHLFYRLGCNQIDKDVIAVNYICQISDKAGNTRNTSGKEVN